MWLIGDKAIFNCPVPFDKTKLAPLLWCAQPWPHYAFHGAAQPRAAFFLSFSRACSVPPCSLLAVPPCSSTHMGCVQRCTAPAGDKTPAHSTTGVARQQ